MGDLADKLNAVGNKLCENVKEAFGKVIDDERLKSRGEVQQLNGTGQDVEGSVKGALGGRNLTVYLKVAGQL